MKHLYEEAAYDAADWPPSYWRASTPRPRPYDPLRGASETDFAVIGAGYAGLNAALELSRHARVVVIDAGQPGWGASGRNGGFCCLGSSALSDQAIVARVGPAGAREFHDYQCAAIDHVSAFLDTQGIPARQGPAGDVCLAHSAGGWRALQARAQARRALYGARTELVPQEALHERGLAGSGFFGAAIEDHGFPLNPLAYLEGLAAVAARSGVTIFGGTPAIDMTPERGGWRIGTPEGAILARKVLIATNGYSAEDLPRWLGGRLLPVQSSILVTRPLSPAERAGQGFTAPMMAYDSRRLLHYFRHLPDGRFLFGGRGGISADPRATGATFRRLRTHFERIFPAWTAVETEFRWSGLACLTQSMAPFIGPVPGAEGLFAALGWHGNGVAAASLGGALAARGMIGETAGIPALLRTPPRRFPFARQRRLGLRLAYAAYAFRDGRLR